MVLAVFTVMVAEPPAVSEVGVRVAVVPAGLPLSVRFTVWAEPEVTAVLMVVVVDEPWTTEAVAGEAVSEKSFVTVPVTVRVKVVLWLPEGAVPTIEIW